jgi:hypothetical protein
MANYSEYFGRVGYHAQWHLGDRVHGRYQGTPWQGTVGCDTLVSLEAGPRVTVHLDLPMKIEGEYLTMIIVKPQDLKQLK